MWLFIYVTQEAVGIPRYDIITILISQCNIIAILNTMYAKYCKKYIL